MQSELLDCWFVTRGFARCRTPHDLTCVATGPVAHSVRYKVLRISCEKGRDCVDTCWQHCCFEGTASVGGSDGCARTGLCRRSTAHVVGNTVATSNLADCCQSRWCCRTCTAHVVSDDGHRAVDNQAVFWLRHAFLFGPRVASWSEAASSSSGFSPSAAGGAVGPASPAKHAIGRSPVCAATVFTTKG